MLGPVQHTEASVADYPRNISRPPLGRRRKQVVPSLVYRTSNVLGNKKSTRIRNQANQQGYEAKPINEIMKISKSTRL